MILVCELTRSRHPGRFRYASYLRSRPQDISVCEAPTPAPVAELTQVSPQVGAHTFLPNNLSHRTSVLDLDLASSPLLPLMSEARILDSTGSDHLLVHLCIAYHKTPSLPSSPKLEPFG